MKVLVTGAFGSVGTYVLKELLKQDHQVRCFDISTKLTKKRSKNSRTVLKFSGGISEISIQFQKQFKIKM